MIFNVTLNPRLNIQTSMNLESKYYVLPVYYKNGIVVNLLKVLDITVVAEIVCWLRCD